MNIVELLYKDTWASWDKDRMFLRRSYIVERDISPVEMINLCRQNQAWCDQVRGEILDLDLSPTSHTEVIFHFVALRNKTKEELIKEYEHSEAMHLSSWCSEIKRTRQRLEELEQQGVVEQYVEELDISDSIE